MEQYGFFVNTDICTGCKACMTSCFDRNNLEVPQKFRKVYEFGGGEWKADDAGAFTATAFTYYVSMTCGHCENPACVEVCPTGAHHKDEETGIVSITADDCIGCQSCVKACPYGAPQFVEAKTITEKCDMCAELQAHGEEPACVAICPQRALKIGDIDELRAEYGDVRDIQPLPDSAQTEPNVVIVAHRNGRAAADDDWRMLSLEQ